MMEVAQGLYCVVAQPHEAPLVHRIMHAAFEEHWEDLKPPSGAIKETVEDVQAAMAGGGAVLVWDGDTPVASARFLIETDHLYVGRVSVLPSHQKHGVGARLMTYMEAVACQLNRPEIQVIVRMSLPANVAFYEHLGYQIRSTEPHPRGYDTVAHMAKRLTCETVDTMPLDERLKLGRALSHTGQDERATAYLEALDQQFPNDAQVQYELACAHDRARKEKHD